MRYGVYNAILHDRSLPEALEVIASIGLSGIEINSGGFLPPKHIPTFDDILVSDTARDEYLGIFAGTGVEIAGLNCNGNPLHPNPVVGDAHAEDVRRSIRLAERLGQSRVVTMSGLPGGEPGATRPNWAVNAWNSYALDILDHQWDVAVPFWTEIDARAADHGVKVALELHPQNLVFNPSTFASWSSSPAPRTSVWSSTLPPVLAADGPGRRHGRPRRTRLPRRRQGRAHQPAAALYGVLDNRFRRLDPDEDRLNLGGDEWANEWPKESAWDFVALGRGHDVEFWSRWLVELDKIDPNMWVNIEHEDTSLGRVEGLTEAAGVLFAAAEMVGLR